VTAPPLDPIGPGYRDAYSPSCECKLPGKPTKNYAGHEVAPPRCSGCGAPWLLRIERMASYAPKTPTKDVKR
jgi:hypothetical protein